MEDRLETTVAIIGGGPACITAAIQLTRNNIDIVLLTDEIGGKIENANLIENLLGFPEGISGKDFVALLKQQVKHHKVNLINRSAKSVEYKNIKDSDFRFQIITEREKIHSKYLVIGTGSKPKKLYVIGEDEAHSKKKLFYENYIARNFAIDKKVIIIGSGDTAFDYALNLKDSASNISIIQRTKISKSIPILQKRVKKQENIKVRTGISINAVNSEGSNIVLEAKEEDRSLTVIGDIVIVAIGREPNLGIVSRNMLDTYEGRIENPSLFFVGDVKKGNFRQVSIAMGDGMKAAMEIVKQVTLEESYQGDSQEIW